MTRATGCVVWPTHLRDTGEGGLVVLAVWRCAYGWADERACPVVPRDPFVGCGEAMLLRVAIGENNECGERDDGALFPCGTDLSAPVLAAAQLGSTSAAYALPDGGATYFWNATRADLTLGGLQLMAVLDALYGRTGELVTILDT